MIDEFNFRSSALNVVQGYVFCFLIYLAVGWDSFQVLCLAPFN